MLTEGPGFLRVPPGLGLLRFPITGLRVWDSPGLPEGLDRLHERPQIEGEFGRPMRRKGTHGQKFVIRKQWLTRQKPFSVGSPLAGKQVGLLHPMSGSHPEVRGASAGTHSSFGVTFQSPAMIQGTSPRPRTWLNIAFQRALRFFQRSGVPWGHP